MSEITIVEGSIVSLAYVLKNSDGDILDQSSDKEPMVYLHGSGQIIPGLETALTGLRPGDKKLVCVEPLDAYGEFDEELCITVSKDQLPTDAALEEGMQFETNTPDGNRVIFTVESIVGEEIKLDGNHPLAGETLTFDIEVLSVRDATEDEKSHGHAHGPGGHHDH